MLPPEILLKIFSHIQDPRDVQRLIKTDQSIKSFISDTVSCLKWNDDVDPLTPVEANLVSSLKNLISLDMPILVSDKNEYIDLYSHPKLKKITIILERTSSNRC